MYGTVAYSALTPGMVIGLGSQQQQQNPPQSIYGQSLGTIGMGSGFVNIADQMNVKQRKEQTMFGFKDYIQKHSDLVWTIVFVSVLDHLIFKGTLREKITDSIEHLVKKNAPEAK